MKSPRLGLLALSACSLFLLGCPTAVDNHKEIDGGASTGSGGRTGSGNGGSSGSTGGSTGSGAGGSSASTGGSSGSGTGGSSAGGNSGARGGASGSGGRTGSGGARADAAAEAPAAAGDKVPAAVQAVFMKCGVACHGGNWGDATKSFARLKGMASCMNRPRMTVGMGAMSLVVLKMKGPVANCGAAMPLNMPKLPDADIKTVEDWISAGAMGVP